MPRHPFWLCMLLLFTLPMVRTPSLSVRDPGRLVLVSYNMHHGEGVDGVLSLQRTADAIRHSDITALQEVDHHFGPRSDYRNQAEQLAEMLNRYSVFAPNLDLDGSTVEEGRIRNLRRQYGTAVLSRYPIEFSRNYLLPKISSSRLASEQRGLLETQIDVRGRKLRVYCTHLSSTSLEQRLLQVRAVLAHVGQAARAGAPQRHLSIADSYVVMGDFNFEPSSEEYSLITGKALPGEQRMQGDGLLVDSWPLVRQSNGHTFGVPGAQGTRIDYIFLSPDLAGLCRSARVDTITTASDHQPLTVVLEGF